ncbi:hypothetical protein [Oricola indica]|uniref:hypothetical protein n=1 Tax=Oricola indica TaxID=2872591 RepID=UPI001CBCE96C|nr:hypothetical protein [Oricola indica]
MSSRHKRRPKLLETQAAEFVFEAAEFHRKLSRHLIALKPQEAQYRAILALSEEVFRAVALVSEETPPWAVSKPSEWSQSAIGTEDAEEQ